MAEPVDMIEPLLREMRASIAENEAKAERRQELLVARRIKLEKQQTSFRHALSADTLMSKLITGAFEEPIGELEEKVPDLQDAR